MPPLLVLLLTFSTALVLTPIAARAATALGWIDRPNVRKVHGRAVPYLGGTAVLGGLFAGGVAFWWQSDENQRAALTTPAMLAVYSGALLMMIVGIIDDATDLRPKKKLLAQVVAAVLVLVTGGSIDSLQLTADLRIDFGVLAPLFTLIWLVGVTNAVNIIDGLDGLCGTLSAAAAALLAWTAFQLDLSHLCGILALVVVAIAGFLPFNLHPAKIFLGDAGSLSVGFLLAGCSVSLHGQSNSHVLGWTMPVVALAIPVFDTLFAMVRRVREGRSVTSADRNHIHHRLLALGYNQRAIVVVLCGVALLAALPVYLSRQFSSHHAAVVDQVFRSAAPAALGLVFVVTVFRHFGAIRFRRATRDLLQISQGRTRPSQSWGSVTALRVNPRKRRGHGDSSQFDTRSSTRAGDESSPQAIGSPDSFGANRVTGSAVNRVH